MRNLFRSTAYHNTVVIDGQEQNRIEQDKLFQLKNAFNPKVNKWESNEEYDFLDAEHYGYTRLSEPIIHQRQIKFFKKEGYWETEDRFRLNEQSIGLCHKFEWYFHFNFGIELEKKEKLVKTKCGRANIVLNPMDNKNLEAKIADGWISKGYGTKEKAKIVKYYFEGKCPVSFRFLLQPY